MKNKLIILFLSTILILATLTSCTYIPTVDADVITMITVDADAKVEFMVNPQNTVVAATPLNDIAAIIISGESFTGKKPDEAAAEFISLVAKAGLLSNDGLSTVKISVSGSSDYSSVITDVISKKIVKSMKKEGIKGNVETVLSMGQDELVALCLENGYITEENVDYLLYNRLIYTLAVKRVSYRDLPTEETKYFYDMCGSLHYDVWIKSETLADLAAKQNEAPEIYTAYSSAVSDYIAAVEEFESFYVSSYFSEDSEYQKALMAMRDAKQALINGSGSKDDLENASEALEEISSLLKEERDELLDVLKSRLEKINEVESTFEDNYEVALHLKQTYTARVARIKEKTTTFASEFNERFKNELAFVRNTLSARKDSLMK